MATVAEVAPAIYRVNHVVPDVPVTFSFFVIDDEVPALVQTGFGRFFDESVEAVRRVIDPARLRYIVVPHFEGDECGALNRFLALAPHAQAVCSPIGAYTNLADFALREPLAVDETSVLDLGQHRLRFLLTPYVHQWDSLLAFDETTGTLFSSDLFIQPGPQPPTTDRDLTDEMLLVYRTIGIFPSRAHLNAALDKIEALAPRTLACHHGSVVSGQIPPYLRALREHDVTGLTAWNPMRGA
ncbi:MAG TPA: FprA family A-type flavoprotein [Chloroflexota bacterium]|nr:FprA family A-type flavoprotein [Chloroflexota bacterium]